MSDLDELFNSIVNNVTVSVLRDSAIILVNEGDMEHPLKTGEYFFDEENNVLYVGGYVPEKFYFWQFISHDSSVQYVPAPRHIANLLVSLAETDHSTSVIAIPTPRIRLDFSVTIPSLSHTQNGRKTNTVKETYSLNVTLPDIIHSSSVDRT